MAAYDQVLAKLGSVAARPGLPAAADKAMVKKRRQAAQATPAEGAGDRKGKRRKQEAVATAHAEPSSTAAQLGSSTAAEDPAATKAAAALSRSSHLARFGKRRAGKNVRRCACLQTAYLLCTSAMQA